MKPCVTDACALVVVPSHACPRPCVYVPGDSPSARILPVEFKGGPGIVFGKDQCDRFAGLPHGKPGRALPAALFAPLNLKRSVLSNSSYSSLPRSLCLSRPLFSLPSRITRLRAFCPRSAHRLARLRQENSRETLCAPFEFDDVRNFFRKKKNGNRRTFI